MIIDVGQMYRLSRLRITGLVGDEVADVAVQATPAWDVHDVVAHITGVVTDALAGNTEGAATDPWTAAQVERGRGRTVGDMVAEWSTTAPMIEAFLSSPAGEPAARAVLDLHSHEADLQQALGLPPSMPDDFLDWVTPMLMDDFSSAVASQGLPPVSIDASPFEVFRSRLGRRTTDEVRSYGWSADPTPYLPSWFIFGRAERSLGETE
jgi:uncharacterized protein (TIGR03083 family)